MLARVKGWRSRVQQRLLSGRWHADGSRSATSGAPCCVVVSALIYDRLFIFSSVVQFPKPDLVIPFRANIDRDKIDFTSDSTDGVALDMVSVVVFVC